MIFFCFTEKGDNCKEFVHSPNAFHSESFLVSYRQLILLANTIIRKSQTYRPKEELPYPPKTSQGLDELAFISP